MRLWSIHPKYLDKSGLVALWREALLAQKVLKGKTRGYKNHPQLERFKNHAEPKKAIATYLLAIWEEAQGRGYNFDKKKIKDVPARAKIPVTRGELKFEFEWLCHKLKKRNPYKCQKLGLVKEIECHPFFEIREGEVEEWEKIKLKSV